MASGTRIATGFYVGTGSPLTVTTKIGFKPRQVEVWNISADPAYGMHAEGMDDDSVYKQKGGTTSVASSDGITLTDDGFTIGADTDLNVADEQVFYKAIR